MKIDFRPTAAIVVMVLLSMLPAVCAAPPTPAPSPAASNNNNARQTYDSFRLVHTRNVFDPDRRPVRPAGPSGPVSAPTRADYVALTGIAMDGDKSLAFFSGSRSEFNLVIPVNSRVAGATVTKIAPGNIEADRNGRHLVINVGQTVPLDDKSLPAAAPVDQPPAYVPPPPASAPAVSGASAGTASTTQPGSGSSPGAPAAPPANIEEIRRRMMERHNQDQK